MNDHEMTPDSPDYLLYVTCQEIQREQQQQINQKFQEESADELDSDIRLASAIGYAGGVIIGVGVMLEVVNPSQSINDAIIAFGAFTLASSVGIAVKAAVQNTFSK